MLNVPEGCRESAQISFIEEIDLRPDPAFSWLVEIVKKNGDTVITCAPSLEEALAFVKKKLK